MTRYIRGWRQIKALFISIENMWLFLIGRDTRDLDIWDLKWCVYSGKEFMGNKLQCVKRELEIFFGFAKPYCIKTSPLFDQQYSEKFGKGSLVELLYKLDKEENG